MSLSRCQLFEAGFPDNELHLNDPSCRGTVQNDRLVFHFDNDNHLCGTHLTANGTHIIYENQIQAEVDTVGDVINRIKTLELSFSCVYKISETSSMNNKLNPIQSCPNDNTVIIYRNGSPGFGQFSFDMFTFEAEGSQVFLHCSVHLCLLESNCAVTCPPGAPQRVGRSVDNQNGAFISMGPFNMVN
ncbi:hypothetical protein HF521_011710 [Silurus meridionalis]|uniref:ZP domain-containing protein n=1 Tax=Silurus meridionalis TaxID=175797 RepID=A0A8T0AJI8_SILME|nr:hypothetical protein HF521_011710 [Silurus meridionalis]